MRKRITVIGDLMIDIDHTVAETTQREGRECLVIASSKKRLGTAGAVAQMVATLGVDVTLISCAAGRDEMFIRHRIQGNASIMGHKAKPKPVPSADDEEPTTTRQRFYTKDWQIAGPRIDYNSDAEINEADQRQMAGRALATAADAFIVCDHGRGVIGAETMRVLKGSGVPIFVDPHKTSDFSIFSGVECLVLNREETLAATAAEPEPKNLINKMDVDGIFWYREGWLFAPDRTYAKRNEFDEYKLHFPTIARNVVDTLGAGDQFIATLASSRVQGGNWETAVYLASGAAGLQCEQRGIRALTWNEINGFSKPNGE